MFKILLRVTTSDPLKKMLIDTPMDIITKGAEQGCGDVAEYVKGTALINAPWRSGQMANAHQVWNTKVSSRQQAEGILATRKVAVARHRIDGHYYPVGIEFGWHPHGDADNFFEGVPWLRDALEDSRGAALGIYRTAMGRAIARHRATPKHAHHIVRA